MKNKLCCLIILLFTQSLYGQIVKINEKGLWYTDPPSPITDMYTSGGVNPGVEVQGYVNGDDLLCKAGYGVAENNKEHLFLILLNPNPNNVFLPISSEIIITLSNGEILNLKSANLVDKHINQYLISLSPENIDSLIRYSCKYLSIKYPSGNMISFRVEYQTSLQLHLKTLADAVLASR